jgi:hypothetical protein
MKFSLLQRNLLIQALQEAEERTTKYYCIPPFRWDQLRYDLLTQKDHGWEPIPDTTLARVRCLQRLGENPSFDFYRIELNDPSILAAAERERLICNIYPFFLYILTHEMVHMVRLSSILDNASPSPLHVVESEEERVQNISRRILTELSFQPIFEKFGGGYSSL